MTPLLAAAWLCVLSVGPAAAQNFLEGVYPQPHHDQGGNLHR